ncbi:MAG: hypothetical protein GX417_00205 [Clostridiales bacterium]|nr:hypothetical protein [Clostridiales bacterium]
MAYGIARIAQKDAVPNKLAPIIVQGISGDNTIFIGFFCRRETAVRRRRFKINPPFPGYWGEFCGMIFFSAIVLTLIWMMLYYW